MHIVGLVVLVCATALAPSAEAGWFDKPENVTPPTLSGSPIVGQTLTTTSGTWQGTQPITISYQWERCGVSNLIPNGAFETDTNGWSTEPGGTLFRTTEFPHSGSFSLKTTTAGVSFREGATYVSAPGELRAGIRHRISFFAYAPAVHEGMGWTIWLNFLDAAGKLLPQSGTSRGFKLHPRWQKITMSFTAPAGVDRIEFHFENGETGKKIITFYLDDIVLRECSIIEEDTDSSYSVSVLDVGSRVTSVVIATNFAGDVAYQTGYPNETETIPDDPAQDGLTDPFSDQDPIEPADPEPTDSEDPDAPNEGDLSTSVAATGLAVTPAVRATTNADAVKVRNADGFWLIYKKCFDPDPPVGGFRYNAGPGYIVRLSRRRPDGSIVYFVNDYRGRADVGNPGYLNAVNGGLATFGWHHARGPVDNTPAGDDPTTSAVEQPVDRDPVAIEGRMCARTNGGVGVYRTSIAGPSPLEGNPINLTIDVWLRDQYGATGEGPDGDGDGTGDAIARVRYRYSFYRSSVRSWISVVTYAKPNGAGTPFVKEPKLAAVVRSGNFKRMAVFDGPDGKHFALGVMRGEPESSLLNTAHTPHDARKRVRWDYGQTILSEEEGEGEGSPGCSITAPCVNIVMRSYPTTSNGDVLRGGPAYSWEGGGYGLDRWAVESGNKPDGSPKRARAYPRDTRGDEIVSQCGVPGAVTDRNGDGRVDEVDASLMSEEASPDMDGVRRWEHGGWKNGDPGSNPDRNPNPYEAAMTLFHGWENGRGGFDCEPLQRAFGPQRESWGTFAVYSLNDGWIVG